MCKIMLCELHNYLHIIYIYIGQCRIIECCLCIMELPSLITECCLCIMELPSLIIECCLCVMELPSLIIECYVLWDYRMLCIMGLPSLELELELNCKNGVDPCSVTDQ